MPFIRKKASKKKSRPFWAEKTPEDYNINVRDSPRQYWEVAEFIGITYNDFGINQGFTSYLYDKQTPYETSTALQFAATGNQHANIDINLGNTYKIYYGTLIYSWNVPAGAATLTINLQVSEDGNNFNTVSTVTYNASSGTTELSLPSCYGRFVRINIDMISGGGNPAINIHEFLCQL